MVICSCEHGDLPAACCFINVLLRAKRSPQLLPVFHPLGNVDYILLKPIICARFICFFVVFFHFFKQISLKSKS